MLPLIWTLIAIVTLTAFAWALRRAVLPRL